jgi:exodeoxyribonuclease VII small subunit
MPKAKEIKKESFEGSLDKLESIVELMQSEELPLDTRLKRFEEGVALVRECAKSLEGAAKKVEVLVKSSGGKLETRLFDEVREKLREADSGSYEVDE